MENAESEYLPGAGVKRGSYFVRLTRKLIRPSLPVAVVNLTALAPSPCPLKKSEIEKAAAVR